VPRPPQFHFDPLNTPRCLGPHVPLAKCGDNLHLNDATAARWLFHDWRRARDGLAQFLVIGVEFVLAKGYLRNALVTGDEKVYTSDEKVYTGDENGVHRFCFAFSVARIMPPMQDTEPSNGVDVALVS